MRHATATLLVLSLSISSVLHAQLPIETGQRVRITSVTHGFHEQSGHVLATTGDSIVVVFKGFRTKDYPPVYGLDTIALNLTGIDRLEVSKPGFRATKGGMQIGAALGMFAGFVYGVKSYHRGPPQSCDPNCLVADFDFGPLPYGLMGAAGGAFLGASIGALIGTAFHEHHWVTVPTYRASVVTRALPAGDLGVGLTLSL